MAAVRLYTLLFHRITAHTFSNALYVERFGNLRRAASRQPEKLGAIASQIYDSAPTRQLDLPHASQKGDGSDPQYKYQIINFSCSTIGFIIWEL